MSNENPERPQEHDPDDREHQDHPGAGAGAEPGGHTDEEIDRRFDELVAGWDTDPSDPSDPVGTDEARPEQPSTPFTVPVQWRAGTGPSIVDEQEPEFEPPVPAELPTDEGFWVTLACLVLGPLWLLYLFFFDRYAASLWWVLASGVFVAGIAMLVLRQPANRDDEDPFDDGARL